MAIGAFAVSSTSMSSFLKHRFDVTLRRGSRQRAERRGGPSQVAPFSRSPLGYGRPCAPKIDFGIITCTPTLPSTSWVMSTSLETLIS